MADPLILEGEVLQHPTTPVINETNMKKKAVMKSAIIARPISEKQQPNNGIIDFHISIVYADMHCPTLQNVTFWRGTRCG